MQTTINATLVKTLAAQPLAADIDVRDAKLRGFVLRWRRSGVHTYRVQTGRGKWYTVGTTDKLTPQQARDEAARVLAAVALGGDPVEDKRAKRGAHTLRAFLSDVYQPWAVTGLGTGDETVQRLAATFSTLLDLKLSEISAWHVERWRTARKKAGVRPTTINRDLNDLRAMLGRAVKWKHIRTHPLADVEPERTDRRGGIVRCLTADEETRLLTALEARDARLHDGRASANQWRAARGYDLLPALGTYPDHLSPLVRLALHTGLRRGELFQLRWTDVDFVGRRLTVRGETAKTDQTRHVPLNAEAVRVLQAWGRGPGLVFPSTDGVDVALVDIKTAWLALMKAAHITGFRFHDCRHAFASRLVQAGVDLAVVRDLLGHSTILMTEKYAHLRPDQAVNAVERLVRQ